MSDQQVVEKPKKTNVWPIIIIVAIVLVFVLLFGFITIQPIGAIPDGVTLLVFRAGTQMKFFDSPDAMCLRMMDGVSLLCRMSAMAAVAENSNIILRLPYIEAFYLASTNGSTFDR
jgi:hypothetical protein